MDRDVTTGRFVKRAAGCIHGCVMAYALGVVVALLVWRWWVSKKSTETFGPQRTQAEPARAVPGVPIQQPDHSDLVAPLPGDTAAPEQTDNDSLDDSLDPRNLATNEQGQFAPDGAYATFKLDAPLVGKPIPNGG